MAETPKFGKDGNPHIDLQSGFPFKFIFKNEKEKVAFFESLEKALLLHNKFKLFGGDGGNSSRESGRRNL